MAAQSLFVEETRNSPGPGNIVFVELTTDDVTEVFSSFGRLGVLAEKVADEAAREAGEYLVSRAVVGEHLADQLLLPMALAGEGSFTATKLSMHARTNLKVISRFLPVHFEVRSADATLSWNPYPLSTKVVLTIEELTSREHTCTSCKGKFRVEPPWKTSLFVISWPSTNVTRSDHDCTIEIDCFGLR